MSESLEGRSADSPRTTAPHVGGEVRDPEHGDPWRIVAVVLGSFITIAGVAHFVAPGFFDAIVPPWLWPSERFWTYASGVAELIVGPMLIIQRTRSWGGRAAIVLFIAVYPANLYMVWDWRDRPTPERVVSWARLPFQFVLIWMAWRVSRLPRPARRSSVGRSVSS